MDRKAIVNKLPLKSKRIAEKIIEGQRISTEDAVFLYKLKELSLTGILAGIANEKINANKVFFNRNIHLEPTNICIHNCLFCSYRRRINEEGAWEYNLEDIRKFACKLKSKGLTEIHVVGGVHPKRDVDYYSELIRSIREELPDIHIKAFTAVEIDYMARKAGMSIAQALERLKEAGLNSMPGGGAEIFDEELRKKICPDKTGSSEWLQIHRTAHKLGIPTNATMLYGHLESYEQRADHLNRLRALQDETHGFNAFIPLKYKNRNNQMSDISEVSNIEDLKNYAVSRIFLDNIPHIKAYWPMVGKELAGISLAFGVDDLDGTINDSTKIYSMAGSEEQSPDMSVDQICRLITTAGKRPAERDSIYNVIKIFD